MNDQTKKKPTRNGYLAVLPDGWQYEVLITHPASGRTVGIEREETRDSEHEPGYRIITDTGEGIRRAHQPTLDAALRIAVKGVRAVDAAIEQEEKARVAREEALASLGEEDEPATGDSDGKGTGSLGLQTTGLTTDPGPVGVNDPTA